MAASPFRVLFVCTGNICRSPMAEALFTHFVREDGLDDRFEADSAGLGDWHTGDPADPRTRRTAARHGVAVPSIARQIDDRDFDRFDLVVAMDRGHLSELRSRAPARRRGKVHLMRDYDVPENHGRDVPDPYYGGPEGFETVYQMLAVSCRNLLESLKAELSAGPRA
jgi:low molecular weight protein-tyrosine phosphatase